MGSKAEPVGRVICGGAKLLGEFEGVSFGIEDVENCGAEFCGDCMVCEGCGGAVCTGGFKTSAMGVTPAMGSLVNMPSFSERAPASISAAAMPATPQRR